MMQATVRFLGWSRRTFRLERAVAWVTVRRIGGMLSMSLGRARTTKQANQPCWLARSVGSPLSVLRENVVAVLHGGVAREPALGIVFLRRVVGRSGGLERVGRRVVLERAPSPAAAVHEPLAVLHHEINVMLGARHGWLTGIRLLLFR